MRRMLMGMRCLLRFMGMVLVRVVMLMGMFVPTVAVTVLMGVLMRMRFMSVVLMRIVVVLMLGSRSGILVRKNVYFRGRNTAAAHLAYLQPCANVQGRSRVGQHLQRDARIHQRTQQHVSANPGKALQIANTHRFVILNCQRPER